VSAWRQQAMTKNGVVDEPATVKALEARLRRAIDCGALEESALPVVWPT